MGLIFGLLKRLIKALIYIAIVVAVILVIPNLPPYTKFSSISLEPPLPRVGPLAPNGVLNNAERVYVDKLLGPEAFQVYKGELYTSLATGEIVKISPGGHVTFVTKLGQPCTGLVQEHICGRPLGFQIDEANNVMYVADAYLGIWKVDLKNDKKQLLVSPRVAIEGRIPKLINSLALGKNGDLYWTDSTSDYPLKDGALSSLSDPSGRLFQYNPAKNQSKVLMDNLWFPNGVVISPDNQFLVAVETFRFRLVKYYIDGPKKGKSEILIAGLPGSPDNVRALPDGSGMLVGLYVTGDDENPLLTRPMAGTPLVRKLLARLQRLIEIPFEYLNSIFPHVILEDIVYHIGHFKSLSGMLPKQTGLVVIDWNGNILESYYNTDGSLGHISDAIVYNNRLYTGNPHLQNFIGSAPVPTLLKKAFESKAAKPVETLKSKVEEKPKIEVKPIAQEKQARPVVQEKQARPVVQEKQARPIVQEKQARPVVQEKQARPIVQEKQARPVVQEKQARPVVQEKQARPVVQEKQARPVVQEKQARPVVQEKQARPVVQEKQARPIVQEKQARPVVQEKQARPVVQEKQARPVEATKPPPPPQKPATSKPVEQPKPALKKSPESTTPKPQKKAKTEPEPEFEMPIVTRPKEEALKEMKNKLAPENIPIREEIPADTAKPNKETLKVIKKDGPAEIPNPHKV